MKTGWVISEKYTLVKAGMLFLLLSLSHSIFAQGVEIIPVQYRSAEDIASQIKALYPEQQVRVVGRNQQLTIRADEKTLDEIKQLVTSLDTAPHQFLISVSGDANSQHDGSGVSGSISTSTNSSSSNNTVTIKTHNKSFKTRGSGSQAIRVLEGHSAYISAGQKKPVRDRQLVNGQWVSGVDYIDMTSGFYVEPRLIGSDQVELKIRTQQNQASTQHYNEIDTATTDSVQIVRLGEWSSIGGTSQDSRSNHGGISHSTQRQSIDNQSLTIKVELVDN